MRLLIRSGVGLALMAVCMAKSNDAGAAPKTPPPAIMDESGFPLGEGTVEVTETSKLEALQKERDVLADDLVRLGDYLHANGFVLEVDGFPSGLVDIAIHHLELKKGYQSSVEGSAGIIVNFQDQLERLGNHIAAVAPDLIEGSAVDTAIKLIDDRKELQLALETHQAKAKREASDMKFTAPDGGVLSPATQLLHPVEEIEGVINTHFRSGGDAVIELHNATGRLKAAVRQVALIEQAEANEAA